MTPLYTDKRRFSVFDPVLLIMAGFMVVQGFMGAGDIPILAGFGLAVFLAFTKHVRYDLYEDALVIRYWAPRKIIIPISDIVDVGVMRLPFGGPSVLVHRARGRVLAIMPKDQEGFLAQIKARLESEKQPPSPPAEDEPPRPRTRRRRPRRQRPS
ncbi:MAG: hypothetical protein J4N29_04615 [Chloroflexi bacterium]|nr:hypothetical protein [Chloroflexota bacterium]